MPRVSQETISKLNDFLDSLPEAARAKCALCNETLTHIVKTAEAQTGAGTATVTKGLADRINSDVKKGLYSLPEKNGGGESNIYVAKISIYPHLVKIGSTSGDVMNRIKSMSGVLLDNFDLIVAYSFPVKIKPRWVEKAIFEYLASFRVVPNKEFFHKDCMPSFFELMEEFVSTFDAERTF